MIEIDLPYKNLNIENMDGEIWDSAYEFDGCYEVSNMGRVKSIFRIILRSDGREMKIQERILRQAVCKKDKASSYLFVGLTINGVKKTREVHRLVAHSFLPQPLGECVVHIDHNMFDNRATNLKSTNHSKKGLQAWEIGHNYSVNIGKFGGDAQSAIPIKMLDMVGNEKKVFGSRIDAANYLIENGFARKQVLCTIMSNINRVAKGEYNYSYKHKWADV